MAQRKGGPVTDVGKAVVSANAITHAVTSTRAVVPGLEDAQEWEDHRAGIVTSLAPVGHLEATLADRAALLLWRLRRVERYEATEIAFYRNEASAQATSTDELLFALSRGSHETPAEREGRLLASRVLPPEDATEKVIRYETHLSRQLWATLHELEALQKRRAGEASPLARVEVNT